MADDMRLSFDEEEKLIGFVQNIELDLSKRDLALSPVNEEQDGLEEQEEQEEQEEREEEQQRQHDIREAPREITPMNRPDTFRRATDPIAPINTNLLLKPTSIPMGRSRTRSPYSRSHLRNRSNTALGHSMTRTHSSPLSGTVPELHPLPQQLTSSSLQESYYSRPESPMGSVSSSSSSAYGRRASPRRHLDEPFTYNQTDVATPSVPTIEEHAELSLSSPSSNTTIPEDGIPPPSSPFASLSLHSTFSRPSRRRPSSPLYSVAPRTSSPGARILHTSSSVPSLSIRGNNYSGASTTPVTPTTPAYGTTITTNNNLTSPASRFNESYPSSPGPVNVVHQANPPTASSSYASSSSSASSMYSMSFGGSSIYSGSSMPSTPTSMRSRSPSISSLDTIPDSPDAEAEAIEQDKHDRIERLDRLEKLRAVLGTNYRDGEELGKRMLGGGGGGSGVGISIAGAGSGSAASGGSGKERKRWSVCGAERRGDLEMETIWED